MEGKKEQRLIRKIVRRGDRKAAGELVEAYYREIFAFVARQTGGREAAFDLTQDIFVSMLVSLPDYDGEKAAFRTWLYRIAANKVVDRYRSLAYRRSRDSLPLEEDALSDDRCLSEALEDREQAEEILRMLDGFPAETQEILRLHIFAEQTFDAIGEILSLPTSTVKTRYYRAVERIRKELAHEIH